MGKSKEKRTYKMWKCILRVKSDKGFTILEMLVVLLIVMTLTSLFPILFSILSQWTNEQSRLHPFEWEVAMSQLLMEVREGKEIRIRDGNLELTNYDNKVISYEKYSNMLRRRVNGKGHEVILQQIQSAQFSLFQGGVRLLVTDQEGAEYTSYLYRWNDVVVSE